MKLRVQPHLQGIKTVNDVKILITDEEANDLFSCLESLGFGISDKMSKGFKKSFPYLKGEFESKVIVINNKKDLSNFLSIFEDSHITPMVESTYVLSNDSLNNYKMIEKELYYTLMVDEETKKIYVENNFENGCTFHTTEITAGIKQKRYGNFRIKYTKTPPLMGGYLYFYFYYQTNGNMSFAPDVIDYAEEDLSYEEANSVDVEEVIGRNCIETLLKKGQTKQEMKEMVTNMKKRKAVDDFKLKEKYLGQPFLIQTTSL
eukprot:TRINITY_DN941_c0_g2_i2.p1 TRINITY_DN941_c0_g2~~TRINITY_DN941_c0_g2_i2.p1  ORF type:complete len:260 (+),score=49.27 TRINITY_DN941_c0_g2_i2:88-867(+)